MYITKLIIISLLLIGLFVVATLFRPEKAEPIPQIVPSPTPFKLDKDRGPGFATPSSLINFKGGE